MWADTTNCILVRQKFKPAIDGKAGFNSLGTVAPNAACAALVPWHHCGSCPTPSLIEDTGLIISLRVFAQMESEHTAIAAPPCAQRMGGERG